MRHYMPGSGFGVLFGVAGFLGTLLLLAGITALIVYLVKRSKGAHPGHPHYHPRPATSPAIQVLDERLARGEIEIEDYLNRKSALLGEPSKPTEWTPPPAAESGPSAN